MSEKDRAHTLTLDEQRAAEKVLREAAADGRFDDADLGRRLGLVYKATTPYQLWKATDGLAGDEHRADTDAWMRPIVMYLSVFAVTLLILAAIGWALVREVG